MTQKLQTNGAKFLEKLEKQTEILQIKELLEF